MEDKPVYIHYGSDSFLTPNPIRNRVYRTKPAGGLWASRKGDKSGWINWCRREHFRLESFDCGFEFTLKDGARVLELTDVSQLDILPQLLNDRNKFYNSKTDRYSWSECCLDFEKLTKDYDAIELMDVGLFYTSLYTWDCNSILIMNPDIVEVTASYDFIEENYIYRHTPHPEYDLEYALET